MTNKRSKQLIEHVVKDMISRCSISEECPLTRTLLRFVEAGIEEYCIRRGFNELDKEAIKDAADTLYHRVAKKELG